LAAILAFGQEAEQSPLPTFPSLLAAVEEGRAEFAVLPIENSLTGSIHENYDLLLAHDLTIVGQITVPIVHHLLALPGTELADLRRVSSHPQALSQCRRFLAAHSQWEVVPVYDTAGAAKLLRSSRIKEDGAIGSSQAAQDYGLAILASGIQDRADNQTRFLILGRKPLSKFGGSSRRRTSFVFSLAHLPGSLFRALAAFALREIDLLKIESRPIPERPWQYRFYLDVRGGMDEERLHSALVHLGEVAQDLRCLGSYPEEQASSLGGTHLCWR
jgi:prephenate dehydratase